MKKSIVSYKESKDNDYIIEKERTKREKYKTIGKFFSFLKVLVIGYLIFLGMGYLGKISNFQKYFNQPSYFKNMESHRKDTVESVNEIDWEKVKDEIRKALILSENEAKVYAEQRFSALEEEIMSRVDNEFLEWYFGYFNHKLLMFLGIFSKDKVFNIVMNKFYTLVVSPEELQKGYENIIRNSMIVFMNSFSKRLKVIPVKYSIKRPVWEKYISNMNKITLRAGTQEISFAVKSLLVGGGTYIALRFTGINKVLGRLFTDYLVKKFEKQAVKGVISTIGKTIAEDIGLIIGVGIIVWEIVDYNKMVESEKPAVSMRIRNYFKGVHRELIEHPEYGLLGYTHKIKTQILEKLNDR